MNQLMHQRDRWLIAIVLAVTVFAGTVALLQFTRPDLWEKTNDPARTVQDAHPTCPPPSERITMPGC